MESANWPIEDSSVDLIVCDFVMEHVEAPDQFLSEARRVLKNGGYICLRTPNRWGYVGLAASLNPNRFHAKVTSAVQDGRKEEDVFPTLYHCNSIWKLRLSLVIVPFRAWHFLPGSCLSDSPPNYLGLPYLRLGA